LLYVDKLSDLKGIQLHLVRDELVPVRHPIHIPHRPVLPTLLKRILVVAYLLQCVLNIVLVPRCNLLPVIRHFFNEIFALDFGLPLLSLFLLILKLDRPTEQLGKALKILGIV
jgi:hypothetical protein